MHWLLIRNFAYALRYLLVFWFLIFPFHNLLEFSPSGFVLELIQALNSIPCGFMISMTMWMQQTPIYRFWVLLALFLVVLCLMLLAGHCHCHSNCCRMGTERIFVKLRMLRLNLWMFCIILCLWSCVECSAKLTSRV